jgi:hypothetical protein
VEVVEYEKKKMAVGEIEVQNDDVLVMYVESSEKDRELDEVEKLEQDYIEMCLNNDHTHDIEVVGYSSMKKMKMKSMVKTKVMKNNENEVVVVYCVVNKVWKKDVENDDDEVMKTKQKKNVVDNALVMKKRGVLLVEVVNMT